MNYWFTSDLHLSHENLRKFLNRPFSSIEVMDEVIADNIYSCLKAGDILYILGDLGWKRKTVFDFLKRKPRNVHFHLIYGNHDKKLFKRKHIESYFDSIEWIKDIKVYGQKITLCHYLMLSWNCSHWNAWHLHGHHHKYVSNISVGKVMNVCADLHNYYPVSFEEVNEYMNNRGNNWNFKEKA